MCIDDLQSARAQRGLTLVELIVFIIIISVGIAGILSVMNIVVRSSADPVVNKQASAMAEAILEEVMTKDYAVNAGYDTSVAANCAAPDRALCDDIGDYACFDGSTAAKTIDGSETLGSAAIATLAGYTATISVAAEAAVSGANMRRITVTVTNPAGAPFSLSGYKASY